MQTGNVPYASDIVRYSIVLKQFIDICNNYRENIIIVSFTKERDSSKSNKNGSNKKKGIRDLREARSSKYKDATDDCQQETDKELDERSVQVDHV